jgi:magnesium transporter
LNKGTTVEEAMKQLKSHPAITRRHIYALDNELCAHRQIDLEHLFVADQDQTWDELSQSVSLFVSALDLKEDVVDKLQKNAIDILPVVDIHHRLLGVIRGTQTGYRNSKRKYCRRLTGNGGCQSGRKGAFQ